MRNSLLPKREFNKAVRDAAKHPWKLLWDEDKQIGNKTTDEYIALARDLRIDMLKQVKGLLTLAPSAVLKDDGEPPHYKFYGVEDIDSLIEELENNPNDPRFLKSAESINAKMRTDRVGHNPSNIADYLRFQILSRDIGDIIKLRAAMLEEDSPLTSYKDQLRRPCEEGGHRAFKFHMEIGQGDKKISVEGQIGHTALEEYELAKHLRKSERALREAFEASALVGSTLRPVVINGMDEASKALEKMRLAVNYELSRSLGLDDLLDPDISTQKEIDKAIATLEESDPHAKRFLDSSRSMAQAVQFINQSQLYMAGRELH